MPETIDWPSPRSRRFRKLLPLFVALAVVVLGAGRALTYYVEALWFGSLGFGDVFRRMLGLQWALFAFFGVLTFALLYGGFLILRRLNLADIPKRRAIVVNGQQMSLNLDPLLRPAALIISLLIAYAVGSSMSEEWPAFLRALFAPHTPDLVTDPIFGRSVSFYLLKLPVWEIAADWLLTLGLLAVAMSALFLLLTVGERAADTRRFTPPASRWRGLFLSVAFLLAVIAFRVYLSRFELLFAEHTVFSGVTYVNAHVDLPGLLLVCLALLAGAALAVFAAFRGSGVRWVVLAVLPGIVCFFGVQIVGGLVSTFVVKPNELVKESPYISRNIEFTRRAYGLDTIEQRAFSAQTSVASADAAENQATLNNIRLWDWHALQDTLRQIQEIRTYYDFPDIDIDRYTFNGTTREVMLAARELSVDKLPESSQNWINERLIYTHGYGVTMNPVNGFTPEGLPALMLRDMPVQSTVPGLTLTRPELYFGELTDTDVYVKTRQKEFNYPQGQTNSFTSYEGRGGIVLGSWLHRTLIAFERGDIAKLPFSDDVTPDSRLLMRRNIRDRVATLAPFLTFDADPYLVVGEDGRLSWLMDAYTTSENYPESRAYALGDGSVNYIRNSVKAVVDAYDGSVTFYVFDSQDPILAAYRNALPSLFRDESALPASLRKHIRYPEGLLRLQGEAYGLYHMTNAETFYNREDLWTQATEDGVDENGARSTVPIQPNYVLMKLPGETGEEFVNILPFTPANRNNLIGWIAGRSDGAHYGSAVVYSFPKTRLIDGPLQVEARIDQNAQISGQLTLWNQQGSHVRRGNLLVIPTGSALLYAESIYLQADQSPMPELRLVVLALQDRLAYGTTFEAAMASLFNGAASSTSAPSSPEPGPDSAPTPNAGTASTASQTASQAARSAAGGSPQPAPSTDRTVLIHQAAQALSDYQRLTAEGKLGDAGQKLEQLKHLLDTLAAHGS